MIGDIQKKIQDHFGLPVILHLVVNPAAMLV